MNSGVDFTIPLDRHDLQNDDELVRYVRACSGYPLLLLLLFEYRSLGN